MSKDKISDYSSTSAGANLNTDIAGVNIDEGCPPSGINNAIRALMSQVKDLQSGVSGDTIPIAAGGTGEATAASARAALGVAIDSDVMKYVAPGSSGNLLVSTGADWTSSAASAVVSSITAGAGISVSASTGDVEITNTGVTDITAGAGISVSANTGSITISASGGGGFANMEVFNNPGTWTNPGNIEKVKVTVVGGGSAGAGISRPGGSGGGTAIEIIPFPSGTNVPVTVGNGGTSNGNTDNATGNAGGTSSFGPYCSATGGGATPGNGGIGGAGSGGDLNIDGDCGASITFSPSNRLGFGGTSIFSGAGSAGPGPFPVKDAKSYGCGGGGGGSPASTPGSGGAGSKGVVIVEY